MIYLQLFFSFVQIGLFSIGGGYAALPLIQNQIVDIHGWLSMQEFVDIISIAAMTPGPIAVNSATFVGMKIAGVGGSLVCTFGCILPSCIIVLLFAFLYQKYKKLTVMQGVLSGLRPAVVSLIASAGMTITLLALFGSSGVSLANLQIRNLVVVILCIIILRVYKPNPILVIAGAGVAGLYFYLQDTSLPPVQQFINMVLLALIYGVILLSRRRKTSG